MIAEALPTPVGDGDRPQNFPSQLVAMPNLVAHKVKWFDSLHGKHSCPLVLPGEWQVS